MVFALHTDCLYIVSSPKKGCGSFLNFASEASEAIKSLHLRSLLSSQMRGGEGGEAGRGVWGERNEEGQTGRHAKTMHAVTRSAADHFNLDSDGVERCLMQMKR